MKQKKLLGQIIGKFDNGVHLLRHRDGRMISLHNDLTTIVLSVIDWSTITLFDVGSPENRPYYGNMKKGIKKKEKRLSPFLKIKAIKQQRYLERELWIASIRYCYYKGHDPVMLLSACGLSIFKMIQRISVQQSTNSIISPIMFISAMDINIPDLLAWHYQSKEIIAIDIEKLIGRFISELNNNRTLTKKPMELTVPFKNMGD